MFSIQFKKYVLTLEMTIDAKEIVYRGRKCRIQNKINSRSP